jgi:activator of HSP90 ATPase
MKTRTIRQTVFFEASPHDVYEALMDSRKHAKFTGGKCTIVRKVGGKIDIYDGYITGENVELVPDKKIVQTWKPEADCWPADHYSKVTFLFKPTKNGTRLEFVHTGVPVECGDQFDIGWKEHYWTPMKEMFARKGRS